MLRMDHYPYSRFWAIWDDQDLVAVVVYKKGAAELLRRLQAQVRGAARIRWTASSAYGHRARPGGAGKQPRGHAAWRRGDAGPGPQPTHGTAGARPCACQA